MSTSAPPSRRRAPATPLNAGGHGAARPGPTLSAARRIGDAVGERNGRAAVTPTVVVPDPSAAAAQARRQRALQRMLDPLLDAEGGSGGAAEGDMEMETRAFDRLPRSAQLPPHPPLTHMLRCEDLSAAGRQLPRFGGARGAHRALPSYKVLARERLRVASQQQLRDHGAARVHVQLRSFASAFSSMLHSAYQAGIVSDDALVAGEPKRIYELLCNVFSLSQAAPALLLLPRK